MKRAIDMFEDSYRQFQLEENAYPKDAVCSAGLFQRLLDGWMITPNQDGSVNIYGVNVRSREDHNDDDGFTFG